MRWPDRASVQTAVGSWAAAAVAQGRAVAVGLFGSLAHGGWGVGSDVDLVVVVERCDGAVLDRPSSFPTDALPVPADLLVYTAAEWKREGAVPPAIRQSVRWLAGSAPVGTSADVEPLDTTL